MSFGKQIHAPMEGKKWCNVNVIQIKHLSHTPIIINVCVYKTNVGNGNLFKLKCVILQKQKKMEEELKE